ncbi:hypothetical protein [Spiroplasma endosymbiont of Aspidapion aeneum]|uniref:hypothetical protein n=1 Tax=Spiroplasma endosymbiont of Aspidapion aeneum TaxID=3066276 RepID=UPI00313AD8CD
MKNNVKHLIVLLVVTIIYFGYSAWIDGNAIYNINGTQMSSTSWANIINNICKDAHVNKNDSLETNIDYIRKIIVLANLNTHSNTYILRGFMAPNSLLKTLLEPFKLILVGGVFASFIPLFKQVFFSKIIEINKYLKNKNQNILYNFDSTILFAKELKDQIDKNNSKGAKITLIKYKSLILKPVFFENFIDEITQTITRFNNIDIYSEKIDYIISSLEEIHELEIYHIKNPKVKKEFMYDLKRASDITSVHSKYVINYYISFINLQEKGGWKIFSLMMLRFYFIAIVAIIPSVAMVFFTNQMLEIFVKNMNENIRVFISIFISLILWTTISIIIHSLYVFLNNKHIGQKKLLLVPAIIYYILVFILATVASFGVYNIYGVGNIYKYNSVAKLWSFLGSLCYMVLGSTIVLYTIATLIDTFKLTNKLTKEDLINGIIIPIIILLITTINNIIICFDVLDIENYLQTANIILLTSYWLYIWFSGFLVSNINFYWIQKNK